MREMSNSSLICYKNISPNKTSPRNHEIDTISIHCMAGQLSVETCGELFAAPSRNASSNYGIGPDGRIGMYVEEKDRSWCTSSRSNDNRAITIEVASDSSHPYKVTDKAYNSLIDLLVDICKRNNIKKLLWKNDKSLIGDVSKQNMTVHMWFKNKACPGQYLLDKHSEIAKVVNKRLGSNTDDTPAKVDPVDEGKKADFYVEITTKILNVRSGPGTKYAVVKTVSKGRKCHIVATSGNWGKLKSGSGWISISDKYVKKVDNTNDTPAKEDKNAPKYTVGKSYKLQKELNVRTGAGTKYPKKKHYQLTTSGQSHDKDKDGALDKGTVVTCQEVKKVGNDIWMRCPSGWIGAYIDGDIRVK